MTKKIYFIGIGGIAMANLACLLKEAGYSISGSDLDTFGPSAVLLKKYKVKYFKDHNPAHIKKFKPDIVVIGNAIQRGNPALEHVLNNQIPYCSMPEIIKKEVLKNKKSIVVAGTSGKTTTTSLLAWTLKSAGFNPSTLVGGIMKNIDSGFMAGNGQYVVVEGDEYNSCFYDSCPKFIHYMPYHAIITNIQPDHLDIYENMENILKAFKKLARIIPQKGSLVLNSADPNTPSILKDSRSKIITTGKKEGIWADNIKMSPNGLSFDVNVGKKRLGEIRSELFGKHNIENILASVAVSLELKIPFKKIARAMSEFKGIKRRLEIIYEKNNITIIDDFAHNPDKVLASLSALRGHFPKHQIIAVFEPRTGSSRRKFFQKSYISSFKPADLVYIAEPYKKSSLDKKEVFSAPQLSRDLNNNKTKSYALKNADEIIRHMGNLGKIFEKPTVIIVMTSGEFDEIHQKLINLADKQNDSPN